MLNLSRRTALGLAALSLPSQAEAATTRLVVRGTSLQYGAIRLRCTIGHGGIRRDKHEGDGATPTGIFPLREVFYRPDRMAKPTTALPVRALSEHDGWCDAPDDPAYNRLVALPYAAHHENLWRTDRLYDLLAVVGFNDAPVIPGKGSAIFLHVASPEWGATDGCVAVAADALVRLLATCTPNTEIDIDIA